MAVPAFQLQEELELSVRREEAPLTEEVLVGEVSHTPPAAHTHTHTDSPPLKLFVRKQQQEAKVTPPQKKNQDRAKVRSSDRAGVGRGLDGVQVARR